MWEMDTNDVPLDPQNVQQNKGKARVKVIRLTADRPEWNAYISRVGGDIYAEAAYATWSTRLDAGNPALWVVEEEEQILCIPLIERSVDAEGCLDGISPYGFGSIWRSETAEPLWITRALTELGDVLKQSGFVSVFLRLHPFLLLPKLRVPGITWVEEGPVVWMDTTWGEQELLEGLSYNHRRDLQRLVDEGHTVETNTDDVWAEVPNIYTETMERVGASGYYRLTSDDLEALRRALGGRAIAIGARNSSGDFDAISLFSATRDHMQFLFGGSRARGLRKAASKLVLWEARQAARAHQCRRYILGGGVGAKEDLLFKFKAGFSPLRATYQTVRWVINHGLYAELAHGFTTGRHFPVYRSPLS
jgi:hypothetical protein